MKRYVKVLALVAALALAYFIGAGVGHYKTKRYFDGYYSNLLYKSAASEITTKITLLELLKHGDDASAQKRLEALVDADLGYLTLYVNAPPVKPDQNDNDIIEAIKIAKAYRDKYPGHQINHVIENSVKKTLDYVKTK